MNDIAAITPAAPLISEAPRVAVRNLSVLAYAFGKTQHLYDARQHSLTDVLTPHYFDDAAGMMERGDWIMVSAGRDGAILYVREAGHDGVVVGEIGRVV